MNDDEAVLHWIRFYGFFIVLMVSLGLAGGVAFNRLTSRDFEASSIVLETAGRISGRQLGPVAEAVFRSAEVYGPAMRELGIQEPPDRFLSDTVDLRPVPETNALIVVGRADTLEEAKAIADATARSLTAAFAERARLTGFVVFGAPQAASVPEGVAPDLAVVLGGAVGFWLAVPLAVVHYRRVRPVIRIERALRITGADLVTVVNGRGHWLGVLRGRPHWKNTAANRNRLEVAGVADSGARTLELVTTRSGVEESPEDAGAGKAGTLPTGRVLGREDHEAVIIAHPGLSEHLLVEVSRFDPSVAARGERPALLWVR